MSSQQPDWPPGLGFGPGTITTLTDIAAGKYTRTGTDPATTHGARQYVNETGRSDGGTVHRHAELGYVQEHDTGPPTLTERGARIVAEYAELARAHLDWQWAAAKAKRP